MLGLPTLSFHNCIIESLINRQVIIFLSFVTSMTYERYFSQCLWNIFKKQWEIVVRSIIKSNLMNYSGNKELNDKYVFNKLLCDFVCYFVSGKNNVSENSWSIFSFINHILLQKWDVEFYYESFWCKIPRPASFFSLH